jgi:CheY-like chemotaxis protein
MAEGEAEIAIADNGIGIPSEQLGRIFEHYRRGTDSRLASQSGLGLGLAIARQIVQMHGGRIWAESEGRGCGSTFRVRLPRAVPTTQSGSGEAPVESYSRKEKGVRILLIEDSEDIQFLMKVELEKRGHIVRSASDGQQGIEVAKHLRPDLIISDIKMPLLDGYGMIRAIRALPEFARTPAIALTGFGSDADIERAIKAGFNACVCKPSEPDKIAALIQRLIAGGESGVAGPRTRAENSTEEN